MKHDPFASRRQTLLKLIGDGIAVIPTAPEQVRNRDSHYPYRADSYFWYLSGFPEPQAVIVLVGGKTPRAVLFCREKDSEREIWDGFRYGPEAARTAFAFDETFAFDEFEQRLPALMANRDALWHALGHDAAWDTKIISALNAVRAQSRAGQRAPAKIVDLHGAIDRLRLIKDVHEMSLMRQAAVIASAGHERAMRSCRPGQAEYELEAELAYEFRKSGSTGHAYSPIVAGGANACILHYVDNDKRLADQSLVLIDAGCELQGYASDITRTFPVNGVFNAIQRDVYEIVLASQRAAIEAIRPGVPFIAYHDAALRVLVQGMLDLKLLSGTLDGAIESEAYKPFYMHRTGHWLGLDVHDVGEYKSGTEGGEWVMLQPGMALTIEPGLYIRPASGVPSHLHGIGIRIEDDAFVTAKGCEVYTQAPKSIGEIEETMRRD